LLLGFLIVHTELAIQFLSQMDSGGHGCRHRFSDVVIAHDFEATVTARLAVRRHSARRGRQGATTGKMRQ
jgi:hypothetical protein